jgi:hypothetical protein
MTYPVCFPRTKLKNHTSYGRKYVYAICKDADALHHIVSHVHASIASNEYDMLHLSLFAKHKSSLILRNRCQRYVRQKGT